MTICKILPSVWNKHTKFENSNFAFSAIQTTNCTGCSFYLLLLCFQREASSFTLVYICLSWSMKMFSTQHWLDQAHPISGNCPAHQPANTFLHVSRIPFQLGLLLISYLTLSKRPATQKGVTALVKWNWLAYRIRMEAHPFCSPPLVAQAPRQLAAVLTQGWLRGRMPCTESPLPHLGFSLGVAQLILPSF